MTIASMPVRPVLSREKAIGIGRRVIELSKSERVSVKIDHQAIGITRMNRMKTCTSQDSERVLLHLETGSGYRANVMLNVNQLDDAALQVIVPYLDRLAAERLGAEVNIYRGLFDRGPRDYLPVRLWHEDTIDALIATRTEKLRDILAMIRPTDLQSAVFVGASARALCYVHSDGLVAYNEETDSEITVTCWTPDGRGSGWGGATSRDWGTIDPLAATQSAIDIAQRSRNPQAFEPGRRVAILGPSAVAQLMLGMGYAFSGNGPFAKAPSGAKIGERVFDPRIFMRSDPADPEGGFAPLFWETGFPSQATTWVEDGVLKQIARRPDTAAMKGIATYAETPGSMRLEGRGANATVEEMISSCEAGIYVNRFSGVVRVDEQSGMMQGVTRDGCFLVRKGKIDRAIKNFRFVDSPFFSLNSLDMIGTSERAALGWTPSAAPWPLPPMIAPPLKIRDFNFAALSDAI